MERRSRRLKLPLLRRYRGFIVLVSMLGSAAMPVTMTRASQRSGGGRCRGGEGEGGEWRKRALMVGGE